MAAQRKRTILVLIAALFVLSLNAAATHAQTLYRVAIQQNVNVKMRDGVSLVADIYRPVSDEKFPVLLHGRPITGVAINTERTVGAATEGRPYSTFRSDQFSIDLNLALQSIESGCYKRARFF